MITGLTVAKITFSLECTYACFAQLGYLFSTEKGD